MPRKSQKRPHSAFAGSRKRRVAELAPLWSMELGTRWRRVPVTAALVGGLLAPSLAQASDDQSKAKNRRTKPPTAVESVMDRQILNAIDAGDGDLATRSLRQKLVEQPANVDARLALAAAYERQGADELAIEHYRTATFQYGSETAASRLARTLDRLGESDQALSVLVQFCDSHAGASSRILSELGILADEMSNLTAGEQYHRRALAAALIEAAPGQDALHSNLGYNLVIQKRFAEAEEQLRSALQLNPQSETARNNLAFALSSSPAATSAQVNEALLQWQSLSGPAAAHNNLAAVFLEQGRYPEARRELERALSFDQLHRPALKNLESLAALDGKPASVPVSVPAAVAQASATPSRKANFFRRIFMGRHQSRDGKVTALAQAKSQNNQ